MEPDQNTNPNPQETQTKVPATENQPIQSGQQTPLASPQPSNVEPPIPESGDKKSLLKSKRSVIFAIIIGLLVLTVGAVLAFFYLPKLAYDKQVKDCVSKGGMVGESYPPTCVYPSPDDSDSTSKWKTYSNDSYSFAYPEDWLGPEEYQDYYVSVGTSKPHKYGEGLEYDYPEEDSYFVTIYSNYRGSLSFSEWEEQPWMSDINDSINFQAGESKTSHGVIKTKIRDFDLGGLPASEVKFENDPVGGTEFVYSTEVIVKTQEFVIRIQGSPVLVTPTTPEERLVKAKELSDNYKNTFDQILSTFRFIENQEVACTLEAMICPDGSSVGRTGPNCEFSPCPSP